MSRDAQLQLIYRACQHDVGVESLQRLRTVPLPKEFESIQQGLLEVRVMVEEVYTASRADKCNGRAAVIEGLKKAGSGILAMAAAMQACDEYDVVKRIDDPKAALSLTGDGPSRIRRYKTRPRQKQQPLRAAA